MSMTKTMVGDIEVWTGDGYVDLRQPGEPEDDHDLISIPAEYVPAVALALLGGITDELIERAAKAMEASWTKETGLPVSDKVRRYCRLDAEIVLAAIGGGGEGEG